MICVRIAEGFQDQRSKVKVICVQMCESYSVGCIHFDGVWRRGLAYLSVEYDMLEIVQLTDV